MNKDYTASFQRKNMVKAMYTIAKYTDCNAEELTALFRNNPPMEQDYWEVAEKEKLFYSMVVAFRNVMRKHGLDVEGFSIGGDKW